MLYTITNVFSLRSLGRTVFFTLILDTCAQYIIIHVYHNQFVKKRADAGASSISVYVGPFHVAD